MSLVLAKLLEELTDGRLRIVDLTQSLSPQTPLLPLPPQFNNTPAFRIWELSRYDERGPAWYWNAFETGEHTGTHFDAPVHWVSGKDLPDNTVDRIAPQKFIGPACVIDISAEAARNPNYLLTPARIRQWEERYDRIPTGAWVLLRTDWSNREDPKDYINLKENGPHTLSLIHIFQQLRKVTIEWLFVAALDENLISIAKHQRAKTIPLGLENPIALGGQFVYSLSLIHI